MEEFGMGGDDIGVVRFNEDFRDGSSTRHPGLSEQQKSALDRRVRELLAEARQRAARILSENRILLETLRDLLLEKKVLDAKGLNELVPGKNDGKKPRREAAEPMRAPDAVGEKRGNK